jgi:hypothetical protein
MFEASWTFNAAFKSLRSRRNWDDNEATVTLKMKKRAVGTFDGESPFEYFDGADMQGRLPSKASEAVFCRQEPTPAGCEGGHGLDPFKPNIRREIVNNYTCDGVVLFNVDGGAYVMLEDAVRQVSIEANTKELFTKSRKHDLFEKTSLSHLDAFQKRYACTPYVRLPSNFGHSFPS